MVYVYTVTEKRKPTFRLSDIQTRFADPKDLEATGTAIKSAAALGFGRVEICQTIAAIGREHFYKSMTSRADHRIWQDVYHVPSSIGVLYVKFSVGMISEFILLSFKEKDDG